MTWLDRIPLILVPIILTVSGAVWLLALVLWAYDELKDE